jgi:DNA-binding response OmpR family regulator
MKILVVDDDVQLNSIISFTLRREGFVVLNAYDGQAALELWRQEQPDLILLDLNLPRLDGHQVLTQVRAQRRTPVILLTVRADEEDVVRGLDLGADDYIAKPFSPKTLLARMRAVLRRSESGPSAGMNEDELALDPERQQARRGRELPIHLTPLEFRLLQHLMLHRGQVSAAETLIEHVWGYQGTGDRDLLKQLIRRLRRKIEPDPANPIYIETVPNIGYSFKSD